MIERSSLVQKKIQAKQLEQGNPENAISNYDISRTFKKY